MATDAVDSVEKIIQPPVYLSGNERILTIINNLVGVYSTFEDVVPPANFESDAAAREAYFKNRGVHPSWYSQAEVTGTYRSYSADKGSRTALIKPWFKVLDEAMKCGDTIRMVRAEDFFNKADLSKPLSDPVNRNLLDSMSTPAEIELRIKAQSL